MIFEGEYVTHLVLAWQRYHNSVYMDDILSQSQKLIEVIVSKYDVMYREDLIQESMLKLQHACEFYQPSVSTLHNFFTTVIHNICITYVVKQEREFLIDDNNNNLENDDYVAELPSQTQSYNYDPTTGLLTELVHYLRDRFKSIPASYIDECADIIYYGLRNTENVRSMMSDISNIVMSRHIALLVFNSALVFLRYSNISNSEVNIDDMPELSLLSELHMVVGDIVYSKILVTFAGITIHIPK